MDGLRSIPIRPDAATRELVDSLGGRLPQKAISLKELLRQPKLCMEQALGTSRIIAM